MRVHHFKLFDLEQDLVDVSDEAREVFLEVFLFELVEVLEDFVD